MANVGNWTHTRLLIGILLVATLVRLPVALHMGDQVTVLPGIHDQVSYDALARSLLAGRGYSFPENWYPFTPANTATAHWSFIYPVYLALVYAAVGYHPLVARLAQVVVGGALQCWLIYLIGRRLVGSTAGLTAAGLAAFYGYFIYYSPALMTETFFMVCVLWAIHVSLGLDHACGWQPWVQLGLALGLASLFRQSALLFVPFLLIWLFWQTRKAGVRARYLALPVATLAVMIAPWTIRNYLVYGQVLLLNSNSGYALYASNNPNLGTDWRNDEVVVPVPPEFAGQNEAELNESLTQRGTEYILSDPMRYLWLTLDKSLEYLRFWPTRDSGLISNLNRVLSFGLYLPFMAIGLAISVGRWPKFALLYLFIVVHSGIHLLSWPSPRYRLPVDAVLMVFASLAFLHLASKLRTGRWPFMVSSRLPRKSEAG